MQRLNSHIKRALKLMYYDIKNAKWVIMFIIAYFAFFKLVLGVVCPMVWITGYPCPACGLTRAAVLLLGLDFSGAWEVHPFIFIIAIYLVIFCWNRYLCGKKAGKKLMLAAIVIIILMIIYYIWRMIQYFPGDPPLSYYKYNLLRLISCIH